MFGGISGVSSERSLEKSSAGFRYSVSESERETLRASKGQWAVSARNFEYSNEGNLMENETGASCRAFPDLKEETFKPNAIVEEESVIGKKVSILNETVDPLAHILVDNMGNFGLLERPDEYFEGFLKEESSAYERALEEIEEAFSDFESDQDEEINNLNKELMQIKIEMESYEKFQNNIMEVVNDSMNTLSKSIKEKHEQDFDEILREIHNEQKGKICTGKENPSTRSINKEYKDLLEENKKLKEILHNRTTHKRKKNYK